jgi:hypothetical protein
MFRLGDVLVMISAFLSFLFSVALWFGIGIEMNKDGGLFVGTWVPSIISAAIYAHVARRR